MKQLGHIVRNLRQQKGLSTKEFAEELGVSVGYLNNLETGQTETVRLSLLEKLSIELNFTHSVSDSHTAVEWDSRIQHVCYLLQQLKTVNPAFADYYLKIIEDGVSLHLNQSLPVVGNQ
jgi:transcriptional regulator with XRE-family HTH domain